MDDIDHVTGMKPPKPIPEYLLMPGEEAYINVVDREGKIDIKPKRPQYPVQNQT